MSKPRFKNVHPCECGDCEAHWRIDDPETGLHGAIFKDASTKGLFQWHVDYAWYAGQVLGFGREKTGRQAMKKVRDILQRARQGEQIKLVDYRFDD